MAAPPSEFTSFVKAEVHGFGETLYSVQIVSPPANSLVVGPIEAYSSGGRCPAKYNP